MWFRVFFVLICLFSIQGYGAFQKHLPEDEYLTGYVQALVDAYYCELNVKVVVKEKTVYLCNLPDNPLIAEAIMCFVRDLPCIQCVEKVSCCRDEFQKYMKSTAPACGCSSNCELTAMCNVCSPCSMLNGMWFPQSRVLFTPLLADPRQVKNSANLRFGDTVIGQKAGAVSFGDVFPVYRIRNFCGLKGVLEFDIEGGIFAVFDLTNINDSYVNCDYFVAGALSYGLDRGVWKLRLWHQSSHLGDEFLLAHPEIERKNPSDNAVDLWYSYQLSRIIRLYAAAGYMFCRDVSFDGGRFYVDFGSEFRICRFFDPTTRLYTQPYFAMHFHAADENGCNVDQTYMLGIEFSGIQGTGKKFRTYGEYHNGFSREGQFVLKKSSYGSFGISYGF